MTCWVETSHNPDSTAKINSAQKMRFDREKNDFPAPVAWAGGGTVWGLLERFAWRGLERHDRVHRPPTAPAGAGIRIKYGAVALY